MLLSVLIAAALASSAAAPTTNPIAMAEHGQFQCYRPDVQKKTCQSIASYRRTGPETYDNGALIALSPSASLETHAPVLIKADAVCGFIRTQDLLAGTLRVDGTIVDPDKAKPILERVAKAMTPMTDKEICTRYEPSGTDFTAKISISGTYQPGEDVTVKWISPADGYTVTP